MDPISQLGWRNRRGGVEGPAEQLMRDVLEAADVVHSDAMSDMAASRDGDGDGALSPDETSAGSMWCRRGGSSSLAASVEVNQEGALYIISMALILIHHQQFGSYP